MFIKIHLIGLGKGGYMQFTYKDTLIFVHRLPKVLLVENHGM